MADDESTLPTPHPKLRIAQARQVDKQWLANLLVWLEKYPVLSDDEAKRELGKWVPEYSPPESSHQERRTMHEFTETIDGDLPRDVLSLPYG